MLEVRTVTAMKPCRRRFRSIRQVAAPSTTLGSIDWATLRYPTTAVCAANLQHLHGMPSSNRRRRRWWHIVSPPTGRYLVTTQRELGHIRCMRVNVIFISRRLRTPPTSRCRWKQCDKWLGRAVVTVPVNPVSTNATTYRLQRFPAKRVSRRVHISLNY